MKKAFKCLMVLFISIIGLFLAGNVYAATPKSATVSSVDLVVKYRDFGYADSQYGINTRKLHITDSNGTAATGICVAPMQREPSVGSTHTNVKEVTDATMIKALYYGEYGYGHNYAQDVYWASHNHTNMESGGLILTHIAASKAYANVMGKDKYGWSYHANSLAVSDVNKYLSTISGLATPDDVKLYVVTPNDDANIQTFAYLVKYDKPKPTPTPTPTPEVKKGTLKLRKTSTEETTSSLKGAEYQVYSDQKLTNKVGVLITGENGESNTLTLEVGTYYVKESKAPEGFEVDTKTYTVNVNADTLYTLDVQDVPVTKEGYVKLIKTGNGGEGTTLKGAQYEVYSDKAMTDMVGILVTDENGNSNTLTVEAGTYYVKEITAPTGYELDPTVYEVTVNEGETKVLEVSDIATVVPTPEPDLPENPQTGIGSVIAGTSAAIGGAVYGLYLLKKKSYLFGV